MNMQDSFIQQTGLAKCHNKNIRPAKLSFVTDGSNVRQWPYKAEARYDGGRIG